MTLQELYNELPAIIARLSPHAETGISNIRWGATVSEADLVNLDGFSFESVISDLEEDKTKLNDEILNLKEETAQLKKIIRGLEGDVETLGNENERLCKEAANV